MQIFTYRGRSLNPPARSIAVEVSTTLEDGMLEVSVGGGYLPPMDYDTVLRLHAHLTLAVARMERGT